MANYYVWGDYGHTQPQEIGCAKLASRDDRAARKAAGKHGFAYDERLRNGFTPWASTYEAQDGSDAERAFADSPIVKGWQKH